jgi:transaldolase
VVKLLPTMEGFAFAAHHAQGVPCCITAVYSPAQALAAREAGAIQVAVYVNRYSRLGGDGVRLVEEIALALRGSSTGILAASLKSPEEAVAAVLAGASHLTLPFETLKAMIENPLSKETIENFQREGVGLQV